MRQRRVERGPQKEGGDMSKRSQKHCRVCGELLSSSSGRYCSRTCRMLMAAFAEFSTFHFILINSRWARVLPRSRL